ncbi:shikimate kinase [Lentibacillus kapialis]|uniref:Shikimate kinase n=1 Tax=Lentibacillus kapialis TaxID=340214 RepID=A0A917Q014_9BACI|nr:shikimate kinase [Lentibacillus kapialis]GGK03223.1 shikimate kinase [Lentibacillus kapialis]
MQTVYLIGFMGSGKSTVGKLLHETLGGMYADTDQMIIDKYGEIVSIFEQKGEKQFRYYESEMLKHTAGGKFIVSTGGGIIERQENGEFMKNNGRIVYLATSFDEITRRLGNDPERPLWDKNHSEKERLYQRRNRIYSALADLKIMTDHKSPHSVAKEILGYLQ